MCGRMTLTRAEIGDVAAELEADLGVRLAVPKNAPYRPRYNLAPTDEHYIVLPGQLAGAHWGLRTRSQPLINARMETLDRRGLFQAALRSSTPETRGRCLVPADGFFEWVGAKGDRHPIWYHHPGGKLLLFAGLYSVNRDGGLEFTVITTPANHLIAPVHDRMPALLQHDQANAWLAEPRLELLAPAPEDALVSTFVSDRVSSVANDDPDCLTPSRPRGQMKLF
jgi:putative SOS response-associated peptidase YedK